VVHSVPHPVGGWVGGYTCGIMYHSVHVCVCGGGGVGGDIHTPRRSAGLQAFSVTVVCKCPVTSRPVAGITLRLPGIVVMA